MHHHHCVHIMWEGCEVATNEDEPDAGSRKHALGNASRSGMWHFAIKCRADESEIDILTSSDLCECHLVRSEEEHCFMAGMYR